MRRVLVKKFLLPATGGLLLASCSGSDTENLELAKLDRASRVAADEYVACVIAQAESLLAESNDQDFIVSAARSNCAASLEEYEAARSEFLDEQYMMYGDKLDASVRRVDERAGNEAALIVLTSQQQSLAAGVASRTDTDWNPDQRVYLDCMETQALKYRGVNQSPDTIVALANEVCRPYTRGPNQALEKEGRAIVLDRVFDPQLATGR